ncbi:unnamed protein product [Musa textilis]
MRQRRWLDFLKDYDFKINYHPRKTNVVADALRRNTSSLVAYMNIQRNSKMIELVDLKLRFLSETNEGFLACLMVQSDLVERIKEGQKEDLYLQMIVKEIAQGARPEFLQIKDGSITFHNHLCVPESHLVKIQLLEEAHRSKFNIHPGTTKMYRDLRQNYWWRGIKRDIAEFVSKCLI